MDTLAELNAKLSRLTDALEGPSQREVIGRIALAAKNDALTALDRDRPGRKFHNWKPKLSVGYDVTSDTTAVVKPRPSGPWKVLNDGRRRGRKYVRKRKRVIGWGPTKGKDTWTKAHAEIVAKTPNRVDDEVQKHLRKVFG